MKKYVFSEKVGKKTTKWEIVAETLEDAQTQLTTKLEQERDTPLVGVGLPDYIEPIDAPPELTLKTFNITFWPDPEDKDSTETITYKAMSMKSAEGQFLEDYPEQAGKPRETHSPLSNYAVDRKNAEIPTNNQKTINNSSITNDKPTKMKKINTLKIFKTVNDYVMQLTMLLISLIPMLIIGVVLFGDDFFLGNVVVYNIQNLLDSMAGFVGIVTLLLIVYFYTRIQQNKD
tara:strand:+ start:523 stop:1215 length:693 start_codon:yes stop_codon:yes gene_type:complete